MEKERISDKARLLIDSILLEPKVNALALKIWAYDESLYKHSINVAYISAQICYMNKYTSKQTKEIVTAALLHDVGKIKIPKSILFKKEHLTPEEFSVIKNHIVYGVAILKENGFNNSIIEYMKTHHENINGTGYPEGVTSMTPGGKIIAAVDKYDALTAKRCYGICFDRKSAMQTIINEKSTEMKYIRYISLCEAT